MVQQFRVVVMNWLERNANFGTRGTLRLPRLGGSPDQSLPLLEVVKIALAGRAPPQSAHHHLGLGDVGAGLGLEPGSWPEAGRQRCLRSPKWGVGGV